MEVEEYELDGGEEQSRAKDFPPLVRKMGTFPAPIPV